MDKQRSTDFEKHKICISVISKIEILITLIIEFYQRFISPLKRPCCRFYPTCSQYAILAIRKHGAFKGTFKAVWRLVRCNPWNDGGVDFP